MINNLKYKNILIFILLSVSFSKSFSRISTTIDFPSNYNIIGRSLESNQVVVDQMYENKPGINIAYEHLGISRENINLYIGGEFMLGKNSQSTMAFHSLYLMPSLIFKEKYAVNTRFGLSQINTDQNNFDLNFGYVVSLGFEYQISNKMALSLSYSMYDMQNKDITDVSGFNPPLVSNIGNGIIDIDDMNLDLKYNKIGLSVVYGFEVVTKKERNEKN
mgnify:CR=1 FL=1